MESGNAGSKGRFAKQGGLQGSKLSKKGKGYSDTKKKGKWTQFLYLIFYGQIVLDSDKMFFLDWVSNVKLE